MTDQSLFVSDSNTKKCMYETDILIPEQSSYMWQRYFKYKAHIIPYILFFYSALILKFLCRLNWIENYEQALLVSEEDDDCSTVYS